MILSPSLRESPVKLISLKDSYDDQVCTLYLKLLYLPLQGSYLDQRQHLNQLHQPTHNTRLMPKIYISSRALGHHQEVHYHVDNAHPLLLSEIQAHHHRLPYPPPACNTSTPKPHSAHSSSIPSSIRQPRQQSPLQTNINLSIQSFIPAAATHTTVSSTPEQRIPKSLNGERVKNNRQQGRSNAQDERLCFHCKQPGHLKKDCPEPPYCSKCRTKGHIPAKCPAKNQNSRPVDKG